MRASLGGLFCVALALACAGPGAQTSHEQPTSDIKAPDPVAPSAELPSPAWPRFAWKRLAPEHREAPGARDVAVAADGRSALVLAGDAVLQWTFGAPPRRLADAGGAIELTSSGFGGRTFAIVDRGGKHAIERWDEGDIRTVIFESEAALSNLVTGVATWDGAERLFFAHEDASGSRILSIRADGTRRYEVTSPAGRSALTDPALASPDPAVAAPPELLEAKHAVPLAFDPRLGALLWRDGSGAVHRYAYAWGNWSSDALVSDLSAPDGLAISPNGWLSALIDRAGFVRIVNPDGQIVSRLAAPSGHFRTTPEFTPDGRALVGVVDDAVVVLPVEHPLAPIRWLRDPSLVKQGGLVVKDASRAQMYMAYEHMAYDSIDYPVFASVDGTLEVLHAAFEAVFLRGERERSLPALRSLAQVLEAHGTAQRSERISAIAKVTLELLDGKPVHPDAIAATEAKGPASALHPSPSGTDWGDLVPRGPYATDPELQRYFRAFKYLNLTALDPSERASLAADKDVREALSRWTSAQDPFLQGSRDQGALEEAPKYPRWVRPRCVTEPHTRLFPLSWGLDAEILDRVVAHDAQPDCGIPYRGAPSGLDLLAAFGSPWARDLAKDDPACNDPRYAPALAAAHGSLASEFGTPIDLPGVVPGWLRVVQLLGREERVPEGVASERWRGRLAETALASWTSLRHTMVLVNATTAAEAGDGGDPVFEVMLLEPPTHAVDPLPAVWSQIGLVLGELESLAMKSERKDRVAELISEARATAETFADYAERQVNGEALTDDEYATIASYARIVEHPYVLLKTAAAAKEELSDPEPMSKIVDIHVWNEPTQGTRYWHAAVGNPRDITVLVGDRGILLPASGAVYSYYEHLDDHRLDDSEWRQLLARSPPAPPSFSPARP